MVGADALLVTGGPHVTFLCREHPDIAVEAWRDEQGARHRVVRFAGIRPGAQAPGKRHRACAMLQASDLQEGEMVVRSATGQELVWRCHVSRAGEG